MNVSLSPNAVLGQWQTSANASSLEDAAAAAAHRLIRTRRTVRRYEERQPTQAALERVFASVAHAPSAHNRQPWRFLLISDGARKAALATAMGERLAADRRRDHDAEAIIEADVARSFKRITGAPVVIVVAMTLAEMDRYPDQERAHAEWLMAVQSTAMAGQNLLLAAAAEGLGACWMCAPLFCALEVKRVLPLPDDWEVQGLVTIGYPAQSSPIKPRKPLSEFVLLASAECGREWA